MLGCITLTRKCSMSQPSVTNGCSLGTKYRPRPRARRCGIGQIELGQELARPSSRAVPPSALIRVVKMRISLVLPAPFGPRRANTSSSTSTMGTSPTGAMTAAQAVQAYKNLANVEKIFKTLKSRDLSIRPIYHYTKHRVRAQCRRTRPSSYFGATRTDCGRN